jgi:uncharacterized protein (TIGR03086 family)
MTFSKTVDLPVPPDEAFALVTDPERLRRWKTISAYVDLRAGGGYRFTIVPGQVAAGTYREVEPGKRIVFGWGWEGDPDLPPDTSVVTVTVEPTEEGSRVTLVHEGLTEEQAARHAAGWNHYFDRLAKLTSTGDAGGDEWAWAPEALDQVVASDAALAAIQPVLRGLTADDDQKVTPCPELTAHQLVEHFVASLVQLGGMAGATVATPPGPTAEHRISNAAAQAIDAWRARGLEGTVPGGGGSEMPASFAASILPVEILLHGWDLAQASGQTIAVSDEVVAYVREQAEVVVPAARPGGSFGPEVEPAAGASPLDALAAYAGRKPVS